MSYCRWSSDDFQCDVYVYEAMEGYTIHIATNRVEWLVPLPEDVEYDPDNVEAFFQRHVEVMKLMRDESTHRRVPIGLGNDGQTAVFEEPGAAAHFLDLLKKTGYVVPQYVIDELNEEQEELERDAKTS